MTSLDQREHALEAEFAHQQELNFQARERAVKALAKWAAERLGKVAEAVEAYGDEIVGLDVTNPTVEETIERIAQALAPAGISKVEIRRTMDQFMATAAATVRSTIQSPR